MATTHIYTIQNKYIQEDALVTDVIIQFSGDITDEVSVSIYHFQPQSVEEVEANIENRIITEQSKIIGRSIMEQIINQL